MRPIFYYLPEDPKRPIEKSDYCIFINAYWNCYGPTRYHKYLSER